MFGLPPASSQALSNGASAFSAASMSGVVPPMPRAFTRLLSARTIAMACRRLVESNGERRISAARRTASARGGGRSDSLASSSGQCAPPSIHRRSVSMSSGASTSSGGICGPKRESSTRRYKRLASLLPGMMLCRTIPESAALRRSRR
jgi:hypothetical protein